MSVKEDLRKKIEERLDLTVKYGFSNDEAKYYLVKFDRETKEEDFHDFVRTNEICNHVLSRIGSSGTGSSHLDKMGPTLLKYYQHLEEARHTLTKEELTKYMMFVSIRRDLTWELSPETVQANEAAEPVWEYHSRQERNPKFYDVTFNNFLLNCDLACRYRHILGESHVKSDVFKSRYKNIGKENLRKLMTETFKRVINSSEEFLNEQSSPADYRIVALAHWHLDNRELAEQYFKKAFSMAKGDLNLQERLLVDMKKAKIRMPLIERVKVRGKIYSSYYL